MKRVMIVLFLLIFSEILLAQKLWYDFNVGEEKAVGINLQYHSDAETRIHLSLTGMYIEKDRDFIKIFLPNGNLYKKDVGYPQIPYYRKILALPDRGKPYIEISNIKKLVLNDDFLIYPVQYPLPDIADYRPVWQYNKDVYSKDFYYPSKDKIAEIRELGDIRSFRYGEIDVYPIRYNPAKKQIEVITECDITIKYRGKGDYEMTNFIPSSKRWEGIYEKIFWNWEYVKNQKKQINEDVNIYLDSNIKSGNNNDGNDSLDIMGFFGEGDYLILMYGESQDIINNPDYKMPSALKDFMAWKTKLGYMPVLYYVSPSATPEEIKTKIEEFYDNWNIKPEFVLIIGEGEENEEPNHIESYPFNTDSALIITYDYGVEPSIVRTDHYYSIMHITNSNDYISDLFVSRFSVNDTTELRLWVDKTIRYEMNPPEGNWYTSFFALGDTQDGRIFNLTARQFALNMFNNTYYTDGDTLLEEHYADGELTSHVIDSIDDGHNLFLFRGHGNEGYYFGWYGGSNYGYDRLFMAYDIPNIAETSLGVGFMFAPTCLANNFTYPYYDAMGELLINIGLTKGVVGYFGATNVSYSFYNDSIALGVSHALEGATTPEFEVVSTYAKNYVNTYNGGWQDYYVLEEYLMNELGDPAARIWRKSPSSFVIEHAPYYFVGDNNITVSVKDGETGSPVEGATVTLWDTTGADNLWLKSLTNADGNATFDAFFLDAGTADLMITVSKYDYLPILSTANIVENTDVKSDYFNDNEESNYMKIFSYGNNLYFDMNSDVYVEIELFDMAGRKLFNREIKISAGKSIYSFSDDIFVRKGVYLYRIVTDNNVYTGKILMVR